LRAAADLFTLTVFLFTWTWLSFLQFSSKITPAVF
jgi:hypothetical protein